jgi:putative phage-type endonuclease
MGAAQGTPEWKQERCGMITASRMSDVMAEVAKGEAAVRRNYRAQLVAERMSGKPTDGFVSYAMAQGTEREPLARMAYEATTGNIVREVGYLPHGKINASGASCDGFVGDLGLVEIKCPIPSTHIQYIITGEIPNEYRLQMAWQMSVTGRKWCDWVSFNPDFDEDEQLVVIRYFRDESLIHKLEVAVGKFDEEVNSEIQRVKEGIKERITRWQHDAQQ